MKSDRKKPPAVIPVTPPAIKPVMLQAEPEPIEIDLQRAAVIVVDMQNAFISKGGMVNLWGGDTLPRQKLIKPIRRITDTARAKGLKVVKVAMTYSPDLSDTGGPNSPNWYKTGLASYIKHPEWRDKMLFRGTWGANIVEELKPQEDDILVHKPRYSAFFGTDLDTILKTSNAKYLVFVGVNTNICVEASIRDAYYLDYFPILISDATMNWGPAFTQEAAILNVKSCYGWVTTTENIIKAME